MVSEDDKVVSLSKNEFAKQTICTVCLKPKGLFMSHLTNGVKRAVRRLSHV